MILDRVPVRLAALVAASISVAARLSAAVTGTVIGPDGAPLPDVRVEAFRPTPYKLALRGQSGELVASAMTDNNGAFSLNVGGTGLVDVRVLVNGFAPSDTIARTDEPIGAIGLQRAAMVEGKVTARGKPIANASVTIVPRQGRPVVLSTDAQGIYRVADPRLWAQAIIVRHPDFVPAWHPPATRDFALDSGKEVNGTVVDGNGRPVSGAQVSVDEMVFATTDSDGKFIMKHVPREVMLLAAHAASGIAMARFVAATPTLKLQPAAHVTGIVRDGEKRPLAGIGIGIGNQAFADSAVSDANGAFNFDMPRGKYGMAVESTLLGYTGQNVEIDATGGDVSRDLVAQRQNIVSAVVKSEDGKPVAGAVMSYLYDRPGSSPAVVPLGRMTGADGSARVPAGTPDESEGLRLLAIKPGLPPGRSDLLVASTHPASVTITIPNGIAISGIVVGKDEKPIDSVRVDPIVGQMDPELEGVQRPWATTDAEGRFTGRLVAGAAGLAFAKEHYLSLQKAVDIQSGMKPLQAILEQANSIAGRVVNKDGSPAAEVKLFAGESYAISGADGSFIIDASASRPQTIQFGRMQMQRQSVTAPAHDVVLVLAATRPIQGRVIDAATSAPVAKFTVTAAASANDFGIPVPMESADGRFMIDATEGAASLTVLAPGYVAAKGVVVPAASHEPVVIKLSRGRTIRGRVVDDKQQPLLGVTVATDSEAVTDQEAKLETSADGSFEVAGVAFDEPVHLTFEKDDYIRVERRLEAKHDDASVEIVMRRGLKFSGRVIDRTGAGVQDVNVTAESAAHGAQQENAETDSSGAFQFSLAPGRYDFKAEVSSKGQRGSARDVDVVKIHEITISLESRPTATLFGHVSGIESPQRGQFVNATTADGEFQTASIDFAGNYRMENAPTGAVEVQADAYDRLGSRSSKKVVVDLAAGSETHLDLAFATSVAVHGHVTRGGEPLAAIISFHGNSSVSATSGPDGAFELRIDPGDYEISMNSVDHKAIPFSQHVEISEAAEINLRVDTAAISVAVLDAQSGQPIGAAEVSASRHGETHTLSTATTAADGTASIDVSRGELVTMTASKSGYANASQDVTVTGDQAVILQLSRTPGAIVRIVDVRDGRTLSGYVIARDASGRVLASGSEADADGTMTLPLPPGLYSVSASAEGFGSHTIAAEVPSGEIRVPLPRGGSLTIRSNSEVRGSARLIQPDGQEYVRCWCSGIAEIKLDGRMTLVDRIAPGAYTLEVTPFGGKPKRFPVSVVEGQTTTVPID